MSDNPVRDAILDAHRRAADELREEASVRVPFADVSTETLYAEVRELESYVLNPHGPESQARDQRMLNARLRELVRRGEEC